MHQDGALGDRQSQSRSADLSGMRLVHTIESLADVCQSLLRDTDSGITDFKGKILMIRIQYHLHPAMILIVFDGILHQIRHDQGHLDFIHLCHHRTDAFKYHFHILLPGDGPQSL